MNIKSKAVLASTLFTALFAGSSVMAEDDIHRFDFETKATTSESVVMQKASIVTQEQNDYFENETYTSGDR